MELPDLSERCRVHDAYAPLSHARAIIIANPHHVHSPLLMHQQYHTWVVLCARSARSLHVEVVTSRPQSKDADGHQRLSTHGPLWRCCLIAVSHVCVICIERDGMVM